ncbi:unnamed protein product, partial [Mesorhabditis spiculigera]
MTEAAARKFRAKHAPREEADPTKSTKSYKSKKVKQPAVPRGKASTSTKEDDKLTEEGTQRQSASKGKASGATAAGALSKDNKAKAAHAKKTNVAKFTPEQDAVAAKFCNFLNTTSAEQILDMERKFIATQGPKDNTIEDFWRMVFQENVAAIISVCDYVEEGTQKCAEYFPAKAGDFKNYGKMFVNNKKVDDIVHTLEVLPDGCSNSIITKLIFCTEWPDKGMPSKGGIPLKLRRLTREAGTGTVVVHCSAGVGRTGTYIAIEMAIQKLLKGREVSIVEIFKDLRNCRPSCVQNTAQYLYIYSSVLEFILTRNITHKPTQKKFLDELAEVME